MSLSANRRRLPAQNVRCCNLCKSLKGRSLEADTRLREVSMRKINLVPTDFWSVVGEARICRKSQKW